MLVKSKLKLQNINTYHLLLFSEPTTTVASHCAISKKLVWVDFLNEDKRFPQGVGWANGKKFY